MKNKSFHNIQFRDYFRYNQSEHVGIQQLAYIINKVKHFLSVFGHRLKYTDYREIKYLKSNNKKVIKKKCIDI